MHVEVNWTLCESNALCVAEAPEVFRIDDEDVLQVMTDLPGDDLRPALERAVRACPKTALRLQH